MWTIRAFCDSAVKGSSRGLEAIGLATLSLAVSSATASAQPTAPATNPPAVSAPGVPDDAGGLQALDSLSQRYRLTEKYALSANPQAPELLTEYQVATRETVKVMRDQPQGTPERSETTFQVIYTERPAKINTANGVTDTVRRYEVFRMTPARDTQRFNVPLLEKLTVWYHSVPGQPVQLFSLTDQRSMREWEFNAIATQVFLPQVISTIPTGPKRVGDTWKISRNAAKALLGAMPQAEDFNLNGTLKEIRKGTPSKAIVLITGTVSLDYEPTLVNARLTFSFDPKLSTSSKPATPGAANDPSAGRDKGVIEAKGSFDEIRMALARTMPLPDSDGRLKQTVTREVLIARRPPPSGLETITIPTIEPTANAPNSWVTYDDPEGRFHFRHPQTLQFPPTGPISSDEITLFNQRPSGPDVFIVKIEPPIKDPVKDRKNLDPEEHARQLDLEWQRQKQDVLKGAREWLPEAEWAPLNRKVYRIEAALKPRGDARAQRIYLDYYLVLFDRNQSMVFEAMTTQDPHLEFRSQAEEIIKSLKFGTSDGSPPPVAARARPSEPPSDDNERRAPTASPARPNRPPAPPRGTNGRSRADDGSEPSPFPK